MDPDIIDGSHHGPAHTQHVLIMNQHILNTFSSSLIMDQDILDTSCHGAGHLSIDAGTVADNLTDILSAMVKCLFVDNRSCIHRGLQVSHR
jgi:hypothetical protein